jgi:hypothetical protein
MEAMWHLPICPCAIILFVHVSSSDWTFGVLWLVHVSLRCVHVSSSDWCTCLLIGPLGAMNHFACMWWRHQTMVTISCMRRFENVTSPMTSLMEHVMSVGTANYCRDAVDTCHQFTMRDVFVMKKMSRVSEPRLGWSSWVQWISNRPRPYMAFFGDPKPHGLSMIDRCTIIFFFTKFSIHGC